MRDIPSALRFTEWYADWGGNSLIHDALMNAHPGLCPDDVAQELHDFVTPFIN